MCACITVPVQRYLKIHIPARPFLMNLLYDFILTPALLQPLQSSTTLQVSSSLMRVLLRNCLFCKTCNTIPDKQFPKALLSPPPPRAPTPCQNHQGKYQQRKRKKPICILCTEHVMSDGGSCWQRLGPQGSAEQNWPHIVMVTSLHTLVICGILCSTNSDMHR